MGTICPKDLHLLQPCSILSSSLCNLLMNSGLFILCAPGELLWCHKGTLLQPWTCTILLHLCAPWSQMQNSPGPMLRPCTASWLHLHLYSSPRLPLELNLLFLRGTLAVKCNRTFISVFSLVQSKLILLADFSTVSGGSHGALSMLLALMMHNTNPSLEQECALMMD